MPRISAIADVEIRLDEIVVEAMRREKHRLDLAELDEAQRLAALSATRERLATWRADALVAVLGSARQS